MYRYLITLLFITTTLLSNDSTPASIDTQINAIKNANPSKRVELMNAFKLRVSQMNQKERSNAISAIQGKMHLKGHTQRREHTSNMQMQENSNIMNHQNMNQHQAGNQVSHRSANNKETQSNRPHK